MTTVVDVARRAGVSSATVSRVLNGRTTVCPALQARVHEAVEALAFRPNPMARSLRVGRTNSIALLVGDIAQTHLSELTMRIQTELESSGFDLLLFNLGHSEQRLLATLERAADMRLRGLVLALSDSIPRGAKQRFYSLRAGGLTIVSVGQDLTRLGVPSIVHEERSAAQRSCRYLLETGHRRIAYVGRIRGSAVGTERYRGYRSALETVGAFDDALVWDMAYRYTAGYEAVTRALDAGLGFSALQAGSDEIAMGASAAFSDRGIRVGTDVAIVGFGDVKMGTYLRPSLTTLSSHPDRAAAHVRALFDADSPSQGSAADATLTRLARALIRRDSA